MTMKFSIEGQRVEIAELAKVGATVDNVLASYINKTYRDLIRGRVTAKVTKAATARAEKAGVALKDFDYSTIGVQDIANEVVKNFVVEEIDLDGDRTVDPVERLAIQLATAALRAYAAAENKALPTAKELDTMARNLVATNPKFTTKAKAQLAALQKDADADKASLAGMFK